jgi:UDP-N-acetylmuramoyl-tripeptide--D-alanyl-D-alanine ligase
LKLTLSEIEEQLRGGHEIPSAETTEVTQIRIDSRLVKKGDVFFCLEGENFDGHNFALSALESGASAVVVSKFMPELEDKPAIMVKNTVHALGLLAAYWRSRSKAEVIAVTGSAGKTTVKEMLSQVLSEKYSVHKNFMNMNNQIGLPCSMLEASGEEDFWVVELGISHPGDMAELGSVAQPDIAVVHNIGPAHIEGLGSLENIAREKASIFKYLQPNGEALCCKDYELLLNAAKEIVPEPVTFSSQDSSADYYCTLLEVLPDGRGKFLLNIKGESAEITLPGCGSHLAEDAAAVACAVSKAGFSPAETFKALETVTLPRQRFCCSNKGRWTLIDDTYNANPLSMKKAIETARTMADSRPFVLVLGDMLELGGDAVRAHVDLGKQIAQAAPEATFFFGRHYDDVASTTNGSTLVPVNTPSEFITGIRELGLCDAVVLFKGSRSCHMEEYHAALSNELNKETSGAVK